MYSVIFYNSFYAVPKMLIILFFLVNVVIRLAVLFYIGGIAVSAIKVRGHPLVGAMVKNHNCIIVANLRVPCNNAFN